MEILVAGTQSQVVNKPFKGIAFRAGPAHSCDSGFNYLDQRGFNDLVRRRFWTKTSFEIVGLGHVALSIANFLQKFTRAKP